jgi:NAD(P)-dependent dehydrogenase (short-subunit alcohol dehydrogenase family)
MSIYEPIESGDSRRHLQLRSPVTLEPTGELVCANADDVAEAIFGLVTSGFVTGQILAVDGGRTL